MSNWEAETEGSWVWGQPGLQQETLTQIKQKRTNKIRNEVLNHSYKIWMNFENIMIGQRISYMVYNSMKCPEEDSPEAGLVVRLGWRWGKTEEQSFLH